MSLKMAADVGHNPALTIKELQQTVRMLEEQLLALQRTREGAGDQIPADAAAMIDSLEAQLSTLYEEREAEPELRTAVHSMDEQLRVLYEELAPLDGRSVSGVLETLESLDAQLHALYEEHATAEKGPSAAEEMVASLEAQVAALICERDELVEAMLKSETVRLSNKVKTKEIVDAMVDCCLG